MRAREAHGVIDSRERNLELQDDRVDTAQFSGNRVHVRWCQQVVGAADDGNSGDVGHASAPGRQLLIVASGERMTIGRLRWTPC